MITTFAPAFRNTESTSTETTVDFTKFKRSEALGYDFRLVRVVTLKDGEVIKKNNFKINLPIQK